MKKYLISISAVFIFMICCLLGTTAYADTVIDSSVDTEIGEDTVIETLDISSAQVVYTSSGYVYSGKAKTPTVEVSLDGVNLTKGTDYQVTYKNNINAGTATIVITGVNKYSGEVQKEFTISKKSLASSDVKLTKSYTSTVYTGSARKPTVTLKDNGTKLTKDKDYTVTYANNVKVGYKNAYVTVKGTGNYKGTLKSYYTIKPAQVKNVKTKARTNTTVTLTWTSQKSAGVTGYSVYKYNFNTDKYDFYKTVSTNSVKVSNLNPGLRYTFKVRAICKESDGVVYGNYSAFRRTATVPSTVAISKTTCAKDNSYFTVYWGKKNCTGYQIQYSTDKNFKTNFKTLTVGSNYTAKKITVKYKNKTYYVRVRAYKQYVNNGVTSTVYGSWSKVASSKYGKTYATYTTNYDSSNKNRTTNLKLACEAINGTILSPGETFSFNEIVGKRTKAKGYKEATIFTGASGTTEGLGGGICQVASTMFNTALKANLKIVERKQHSQKVTYTPNGRDAAIYWGSTDFKFKNNTNYPIKIVMSCTGGKLTCTFKVCQNVSPKDVSLKVTKSNKTYTLKRYVDGKCNYTTKSTY